MKKLCTLLIVLCVSTLAYAQTDVRARGSGGGQVDQPQAGTKRVSGKVVDENGEPLTGATIQILDGGTKNVLAGGYTDANGEFDISVAAGAGQLIRVQYVGYKVIEVSADAQSQGLSFTMSEDVMKLDEVVVTGLATSVKRSNLANAVTSISSEELVGTTRPVTLDAAFSGKIPGALITQNSGAPGGGILTQLRGVGTVTGNSEPLYVVDGVIINNSQFGNGRSAGPFTNAGGGGQDNTTNRLSDINPADIEDVTILKGPSAAAIYGQRGGSGVVLITTKRGQAGKTKVSVGQDVGFVSIIKYLGTTQWDASKLNLFWGAAAPGEIAALNAANASGGVIDYEREAFGRVGAISNTRVSVSGGNEKTKFYVGGNINYEEGIQRKSDFRRNSISVNVDHKFTDYISVNSQSKFFNTSNNRGWGGNDNNGVGVPYTIAVTPNYAQLRQRPDGTYPDNPYAGDNPLAIIDRGINFESTNRFIQNLGLEAFFLKQANITLKLDVRGGLDYLVTESEVFLPNDMQSQIARGPALAGADRRTTTTNFNNNFQSFLVANYSVGGGISMTSQAGFVRLSQSLAQNFVQGEGLPPNQRNPALATTRTLGSFTSTQTDIGYVLQQDFNWSDRVILGLGVRFDKSSLNYPDPQTIFTYPKGSLAVNIAKFPFWNIDKVELLKARFAFGETGNPAPFGSAFSQMASTIIGGQGGLTPATVRANPNVRFERQREVEMGLDLATFGGRLGLEYTYYIKTTLGFNFNQVPSPATGVTSITGVPVGDIQNTGMEVSVYGTPVKMPNVTWETRVQWWYNRSRVTRLIVPPFFAPNSFGNTYGRNQLREGMSPTMQVGSPTNSDGTLTTYGDYQPEFQMTWYNRVIFLKHFEFTMLWQWKKGGVNVNLTKAIRDGAGTTPDWFDPSPDPNFPTIGAWRLAANNPWQAQSAEDATYLRLREIGLYYNIPKAVFGSIVGKYIQGVRVGMSANNFVTITKYSGYDPEVSNFGSIALNQGQDLVPYPNTKRFFFHVNIDF